MPALSQTLPRREYHTPLRPQRLPSSIMAVTLVTSVHSLSREKKARTKSRSGHQLPSFFIGLFPLAGFSSCLEFITRNPLDFLAPVRRFPSKRNTQSRHPA